MEDWAEDAGFAVTLCDRDGTITYMNARSRKTFEKYGGGGLVGKSLLDCHPEPAKSKLRAMLEKPAANAYTIEKAGLKKLIYQAPLIRDGAMRGLVELSVELPAEMPHFVRKP
ncbi:MAG: PAS domain-containing protein [Elusimicrobiales bacterium]|jgi:transcriptional regulator with PAS, ATPase and Fis domain|nr:PAS domain-containing protein [Elusimicrobiales bacterium]